MLLGIRFVTVFYSFPLNDFYVTVVTNGILFCDKKLDTVSLNERSMIVQDMSSKLKVCIV